MRVALDQAVAWRTATTRGARKETENMWKRDQVALPGNNEAPASPPPNPPPSTPAQPPVVAAPSSRPSQSPVPIGRSVVIKGELSGSEDLAVEGTVEGTIELRDNVLTIGPNGRIKAQIFAKTVIVLRNGQRQHHGLRSGRHPRCRLGRREHRVAARGDRGRRPFPGKR